MPTLTPEEQQAFRAAASAVLASKKPMDLPRCRGW